MRGPFGSETVLGKYDYNAEGLRIRHRNSERGDVDYFYDGNAVIEERNAADNSLLAHYRYADRLVSLYSVLSTQYYHFDGLGSTVNLTDTAGTTQVSYNLDPWGRIRSQSGSSLNRMIFTGQEHDENTGLIYFGARFYDADTARFITQDSYLGEPGTPPSLHRYLYAYGNPTVYIDLQGYLTLEKHQEASIGGMKQAVKSGNFVLPQGILNSDEFERNLQIGSMLPDVQYDKAVEAYYVYSWKQRMPIVREIEKALYDSRVWVEEQVVEARNAVLKKYAPNVYITVEKVQNWWDDNSIVEPGIRLLSEKYPEVKDIRILRTHYFDLQWQHGMGEDSNNIRDNIIYDTIRRLKLYDNNIRNGEMNKAARELGVVLHYLQDTWTPSHVARDEKGNIKYMYDYTKQSPKLHSKEDDPDSASPVMLNAINNSAALLKLIQDHSGNYEALEKALKKDIYPISYDTNYPNRFAPRASREDAINAVKPYINPLLKPFNADGDTIKIEVMNMMDKYQEKTFERGK